MADSFELHLNSPLTKEDWDKITDAELEHTTKITYETPSGKKVVFIPLEKIKSDIGSLIDNYQDEVNRLQEHRRENRGIGFDNALTCGKIGAYGKAVADLRDLLEGVEE